MRKSDPIIASTMDGSEDVKAVFQDKYEKLYNSANDEAKLVEVLKETEAMVTECSVKDVEKVSPELIREATQKLKAGKSDPMYSFTSDYFKNVGELLYDKLSIMIRGFLVHGHGHVTLVLLLATHHQGQAW